MEVRKRREEGIQGKELKVQRRRSEMLQSHRIAVLAGREKLGADNTLSDTFLEKAEQFF